MSEFQPSSFDEAPMDLQLDLQPTAGQMADTVEAHPDQVSTALEDYIFGAVQDAELL